mgnify:CR=1 FL=1
MRTSDAARRRSLGIVATLGAIAALAAGCATPSVRPVPYEQTSTEAWFAAAGDYDVDESYKADYEEGRAAYEAEDYVDAVNRYGALAAEGSPEAAYELGKAYRYGNGVPQDSQKAAEWLIAAVSQPNARWPHAAYHLGTMFVDGEGVPQDYALARRLLEASVESGYLRAALPLAQLYAEGKGVAPDPSRAGELALRSAESGDVKSYLWLLRGYQPGGVLGENPQQAGLLAGRLTALLQQRIAEHNDPRAFRDLAIVHYQGLGVPPDRARAMQLLERAAQLHNPQYLADFGEDVQKGTNGFQADPPEGFRILRTAATRYWNPEAMAMVAEAYRDGLGTRADPVAAENWFQRAVNAGSVTAKLEYGRMLVERRDDPQAVQQGVALLEQAATAQTPYAWATLGELNVESAFPGADPARGIDYLERAHQAGIASATADLGQAYLEGRGVEQNSDKAVPLLQDAAEAGQPGAMMALGQGYLEGKALPRRPDLAKTWLEKADAAGVQSARFMLGRALLSGEIPGDAAEGLRIVASYAQSGDTLAMMDLGRAMRDGKTVPRDLEAARRWFENAMQAGDPAAKPALASMLYQEGSSTMRLATLEEAARLGHTGAMSQLGRAYLRGEGVPANPVKGRVWLERAAEAGNLHAAQTLGSAYLHGEDGVERDTAQARRLLERAVDAGDVNAERDLGYALIKPGDSGFPPDIERGLRLLTIAAQKGDRYAMELLGRTYLEGSDGIQPDPENAQVWLARAAERGDLSSMTALGSGYLDNTLPGGDAEQGMRYLEQAADQGDDTARAKLGSLYLTGSATVPAQPAKGAELLKAAADNGHPGAMAALGRAYLDGTLGERRVDEGARLLFEAARTGHPTARYVLAEAFLQSQGLESANRDYAQAWLETVVAGDTDAAVATLTEMLRESKVQPAARAAQPAGSEAQRP